MACLGWILVTAALGALCVVLFDLDWNDTLRAGLIALLGFVAIVVAVSSWFERND